MTERIVHELAPKQPSDIFQIPGIDFAPRLASGESVSGIAIVISEIQTRTPWALGPDVTATMLITGSESVTANVATFRVQAGLHNKDYVARVRATIPPNSRVEDIEVIILVRERPH